MTQKENWYALYTYPKQEEKVQKYLKAAFGETLRAIIPTRELRERKGGRWTLVKRKLFPGYVLAKGYIDMATYEAIKKSPVLAGVLRDEDGPLTIDPQELAVLRIILEHHDGQLEMSHGFKAGEEIIITGGPLVGLAGQIAGVDARKGRARVKLDFLGVTRVVQLGLELVEKAEGSVPADK